MARSSISVQRLRFQYSLHFRFLLTIVNTPFAARRGCGSLAQGASGKRMKVLVIGGEAGNTRWCGPSAGPNAFPKWFARPAMRASPNWRAAFPPARRDVDDLLRVTAAESPDLVVVGPELPLSLGLVDELQRRSIPVFGPTRKAAQLESSKAFAKRFMQRHQIPTAAYAVATSEHQAMESIDLFHLPVVIKADGLASGKGVVLCETRREATEAISGLLGGKLLGRRPVFHRD